jgi:hypothetical protein
VLKREIYEIEINTFREQKARSNHKTACGRLERRIENPVKSRPFKQKGDSLFFAKFIESLLCHNSIIFVDIFTKLAQIVKFVVIDNTTCHEKIFPCRDGSTYDTAT